MAKYTKPDMRERWADAGNIGIPTSEKIEEGWVEEIPPSEIANFIENRQDEALAYLMQQGIPEWEVGIEYQSSSFIQYEGKVYKSSGVNIGQQPDISPLSWTQAFDDFGAAQAVQDAFDDFASADDPLPQYVQENNSILTGDTQAERIELDVLNVRKGTPSVGVPKGVAFGALQTTGFYQATDDKVVYQQAGVTTGFMPSLATIPTSTNDKTIVTAEWVRSFISDAIYPIGGLYTTTVDANPATLLGFGTWQRFAEGRALVGFSSDVTSATPDWLKAVSNTFGEYATTLSVAQMPSHKHGIVLSHETGGVVDASGYPRLDVTPPFETHLSSEPDGSVATLDGGGNPLLSEGGGQPHNNVQPSIVVFIWRRVT